MSGGGGYVARHGFRFQDLFLLLQMTSYLAKRQKSQIDDTLSEPSGLKFGVESKTPKVGNMDWDVLVLEHEKKEVMEVKSGAISRDDRKAFWLRLREELYQAGSENENIIPVLVIDSENQPAAINAWMDLGKRNSFKDLGNVQAPQDRPDRVDDELKLIYEALYWLCAATTTNPESNGRILSSNVTIEIAKSALLRFQIRSEKGSELEENVEKRLDLLIAGPDPTVFRRQMEGWLTEKATQEVHKQ